MTWILKILQGPNEGAEIELADNSITAVGQADDCDIVLADSAIPRKAFELDCKPGTVTLTPLEDGCFLGERRLAPKQAEAFPACTVLTLGATRLCVGPADQPWPEITWPDLEKLRIAALPPLTETELRAIADKVRQEAEAKAAEEQNRQAEAEAIRKQRPILERIKEKLTERFQHSAHNILHYGGRLLLFLGLLCLMIAAGWKVYLLATPPQDQQKIVENIRQDNFSALVKQFSLALTQKDGRFQLAGNLARRNDRLHIANTAFLAHPDIQLALSDDESLQLSIREMLSGLSEGTLVLDYARQCSARIHGILPNEQAWKEAKALLLSDVPMLKELTANVIYADVFLKQLRTALKAIGLEYVQIKCDKNVITFSGHVPASQKQILSTALKEAGKAVPENVCIVNAVKWEDTEEQTEPFAPVSPVAKHVATSAPAPKTEPLPAATPLVLPITGIMITPYRCLMLKDGTRCTEGGTIQGYVIDSIKVDEVTLRRGGQTFQWHP